MVIARGFIYIELSGSDFMASL